MYNNKKVSFVFSTYNEKESIRKAVDDTFYTGFVDEVIVINNNAAKGTEEEVAKTKAIQIFEKKQGYGFGYRRGLNEATGDLIILSEPDGTFHTQDIEKFLVYSNSFDVVFGTRTTNSMILEGANMGLFLKWGNWFVAKLVEVLFGTTHLSDVGCTMRLLKRTALNKIKDQFTVGSSHFGLEMMLLVITNNLKFVEIPIHYDKRIGESSVTGSFYKSLKLGSIMIVFVLKHRIKSLLRK